MFALTKRGELPDVVEDELEQLVASLRTFANSIRSADGTLVSGIVTYASFAPATGLSVIGRSSNSSGSVGDIVATGDHQVLRRSGSTLGFGNINGASFGPQPANYALIGPESGADAVPTFRLVSSGLTPAQVLTRVYLGT